MPIAKFQMPNFGSFENRNSAFGNRHLEFFSSPDSLSLMKTLAVPCIAILPSTYQGRALPLPKRWKCTQVVSKEAKTIGEQINLHSCKKTGRCKRRVKRRRLALHILEVDLAMRLGFHWGSIQNWERGGSESAVRHLAGIIELLGYDFIPAPKILAVTVG